MTTAPAFVFDPYDYVTQEDPVPGLRMAASERTALPQ